MDYKPTKFKARGSHYDKNAADYAVNFIQQLTHTKGKWAGEKFKLLPWQEQIVRDIFGTLKANGKRQFNTAYIEISKKQGKSELAAAIALYLLFADGEPSPEVYGAAADRQQASIVYDVARQMVIQSQSLSARAKVLAANKRINNKSNNGFYQVLSAEVGCVMPDTIVQLADGSIKQADEVVEGDILLAHDGCEPVFDEVTSVRIEEPAEVLEITTCHNRKVCVTENHPFLTMIPGRRMQDLTHEYQWIPANELGVNSRIGVSLGWPSSCSPGDGISEQEAWALGAGTAHKSETEGIPDAIWRGGPKVWAAFLAGYLDTDGTVDKKTPRISICSTSEEMRKGCQLLFARLGINASLASNLRASVSGKPQIRQLYHLLGPYMTHPEKRKRLEHLAQMEIHCRQRANESDKVKSIKSLGELQTISFEMKRYSTHSTNGLITHNTKHGLNVSGLVLDEVHVQPNRKLYDVLTQGSGDAREQPLYFLITTAGNDLNSFCYELHQKAKDILEGRKIDPTFYPVIYGAGIDEDWTDPEVWKKANPSLGHTITLDKVRAACESAQQNPGEENAFRQLRLNQWVKQSVRWMPMEKWDACAFPVEEADLEGRVCYGGLDLSQTTDITAFVLVFPPRVEKEKYIVLPYFWIPEENIRLRVNRDHVPYDVWERQGMLLTTEGNVVHYGYIEKFIQQLGERFNLREIAFDRWGAVQMSQNLEEMGFTVVPFGQGFKDMSPPTKELMKLVLEQRIAHGGHPVLRWMMDNIYIKTDPAGNIKPDKEKSTEKIDGAVALVMALDRAIRNGSSVEECVYDHRGLIFI